MALLHCGNPCQKSIHKKTEIAQIIECLCLMWDSCKLIVTQANVINAENLLKENQK